jgi:hypothetical protein
MALIIPPLGGLRLAIFSASPASNGVRNLGPPPFGCEATFINGAYVGSQDIEAQRLFGGTVRPNANHQIRAMGHGTSLGLAELTSRHKRHKTGRY